MPIRENELVIPALIEIYNSPNHEMQTTQLRERIRLLFPLDAHDLEMLQNRADQKYTQIVRNLKSHKTLRKKHYAVEIEGGFRLTRRGIRFLEDGNYV